MSAALRENELAIRTCILYEALDDKPIEESYKNFCRKVGKDAMTLYDFDYWFYRFLNGNHDLHHDRSEDSKQLTLSDMPIGVMPEILSHVHPVDRLVLRKVSQGLRQVVQSVASGFDYISLTKHNDSFIVKFPSGGIMYSPRDDGCSVTNYKDPGRSKPIQDCRRTVVEGGDYRQLFHNDCKQLMENRRVVLKSLYISLWHDNRTTCDLYLRSVIEIIKSATKFTTTSLSIFLWSYYEISQILTLIQPESLEDLEFSVDDGSIGYEHVVNTEQWKMAKYYTSLSETVIPIEHLLHFTTFTVRLMEFTVGDARKIRDMLDTSDTFEKAEITVKTFDSIEIARVFGPDFELGADENENEEFYYTNSNDTEFRIEFSSSWGGKAVTIEYLDSDGSDDSKDSEDDLDD